MQRKRVFIFIVWLPLMVAGCSGNVLLSAASPTPIPTRTFTVVSTPTFSIPATPSPTLTAKPTVTATPRPAIIAPGNVAQIQAIATWKSPNDSEIKQVVWSPDGKILAALENENAVLWDVAAASVRSIIPGPNDSLSISPDGRMLAAGLDDGVVKLWDTITGHELKNLGKQGSPVKALSFSPDGRLLWTGSTYGPQKFWEVATGRVVNDLDDQVSGVVVSAAFSPDGKMIAIGTGSSRGGGIELWNVATVDEVADLFDGRDDKYSVAFSPDGRWLASGSLYGNVKLWNLAEMKEANKLELAQASINSVAFSPQGDLLAVTSRDSIRLVQVPSAHELRKLVGHTNDVYSVAFSPDGTLLASGSQDGTVRVWAIQH